MRFKKCVKRPPYSFANTESNGEGPEAPITLPRVAPEAPVTLPHAAPEEPITLPHAAPEARVRFVPEAPIRLPRIKFPAFIRTMKGNMVRKPGSKRRCCSMPIPKTFVTQNLKSMHWSATITGPGNKDFRMVVGSKNPSPTSTRYYLLDGWEEYADFYGLKVGDNIKFILLSKNRYYTYVLGKRLSNEALDSSDESGSEEDAPTAEEPSNDLLPTSEERSNHLFPTPKEPSRDLTASLSSEDEAADEDCRSGPSQAKKKNVPRKSTGRFCKRPMEEEEESEKSEESLEDAGQDYVPSEDESQEAVANDRAKEVKKRGRRPDIKETGGTDHADEDCTSGPSQAKKKNVPMKSRGRFCKRPLEEEEESEKSEESLEDAEQDYIPSEDESQETVANGRAKGVKKRGRRQGFKVCGNGVHVCGTDVLTGKPQFLKRVTKVSSNFASMYLNIPMAFMRCHQLEGPIHLEAPNGQPWNASISKNSRGKGILSHGWKAFFQHNNFKMGDLLTFTMTRHRYFKVRLFVRARK